MNKMMNKTDLDLRNTLIKEDKIQYDWDICPNADNNCEFAKIPKAFNKICSGSYLKCKIHKYKNIMTLYN